MIELSPKQQSVELIRQSADILVVSHKNPDGDSLGSAIALKIALEKMGKKVTVAVPDEPSKIFTFLPFIDKITIGIGYSKDFVILLDTSLTEVENLGYKKLEGENAVEIVITPKSGVFKESDISFKKLAPTYDLIISVDTPNFERLGKLAQPADIFYETPVINIDHHPSNERFGKVNWVELTATSTAEILVSLIEALSKERSLIDDKIATALLTGLIYDTSSFQNVNTTPKSLTIAAQLVAGGANQQEIIRNLYKTKSLETLKLWGFILSSVQEDKDSRFLWSSVTKTDIDKIGADDSALSGVVDELLKSATDVDFAMLLSEREGCTHGSLRSITKGFNVAQIAEMFNGGGHEVAAAFRLDGDLKENQTNILEKIRQFRLDGYKKSTNEKKQSFATAAVAEQSKPESKSVEQNSSDKTDNHNENDGVFDQRIARSVREKIIDSPIDLDEKPENDSNKINSDEKIRHDFPPTQSIEEELGFGQNKETYSQSSTDGHKNDISSTNGLEESLNPREKTIKQTKW
jgi:phosphoesterase RecJ-like protein